MLLTPEPKFGRDHQQDKRQVYIFFAQPSGNCMILDKVPSASNSAKQKKGNDPEMSKNLPRVHLPAGQGREPVDPAQILKRSTLNPPSISETMFMVSLIKHD